MVAETLIAEFTNGSRRVAPKLTIAELANGRRAILETLQVTGKREARAIAFDRGAQPWNF